MPKKHSDGSRPAHSDLQLGWNTQAKRPIGFHRAELQGTAPRRPELGGPEGHLITVAPTGSGKGRSAIIPTLLTYPGPMLVIDPKGEAARITARRRLHFGPIVIIDPFKKVTQVPDSLNPLDLYTISGGSITEFSLFVSDLLQMDQVSSLDDPFWDRRATALMAGFIAYIMTGSAKRVGEKHLGKLRDLFSYPDIKMEWATLLDTEGSTMSPFAYKEIGQVLSMPDNTHGSVLATAQQHVYLFDDEAVVKSLATTSFDLRAWVEGLPMTIFLVMPPSKLSSHASLLRLWLATLLSSLFERTALPPLPNLLLIDEAAQLGELNSLRTAMTLMRGYGLRCWTFWQDLAQLKWLYPSDWQTIINNAAAIQTFGVNNQLVAKELSELVGDLSPSELRTLAPHQQVIVRAGSPALVTDKLDYLKDRKYRGHYDPHPMFGKGGRGR